MKISHKITINAPKETVWKVTLDVENWHQWTPTIEWIKKTSPSDLAVGSEVLIKQPKLPETPWRVSKLIENQIFAWQAKIRGMPTNAIHRIESQGNAVVNQLELEMSGLVAFLLWPVLKGQLSQALEQENTGLKRYCESLVHQTD